MDMKNMKERKVLEQEWRKGPWAPEEDKLLNEYVSLHGEGRWTSVAKFSGLKRCGKSCRLRWVNYLRPGLKRGHITPQEEGIIIELHALWGNKWSTIARYLHGRTDNEIKNYWRTHFKNKDKASAHKQLKQRAPLGLPENLQTPKRRHHHHYENDMKSSSPPEAQDQAAPSQDQQVHELASLMDLDDQCLTPTKIYWDASLWNNNCSLMGSDQECGLWGGLWNLDDDGPYNKKTMMNLNDQDHGYADQQNVSYPTSTDNGNEG